LERLEEGLRDIDESCNVGSDAIYGDCVSLDLGMLVIEGGGSGKTYVSLPCYRSGEVCRAVCKEFWPCYGDSGECCEEVRWDRDDHAINCYRATSQWIGSGGK
jgi:hypothetical protein